MQLQGRVSFLAWDQSLRLHFHVIQVALAIEVNMACIWHGMAIAIRVRVEWLQLIDTLRGRYYKTSLSAELIT
jgi:hypothetical protein